MHALVVAATDEDDRQAVVRRRFRDLRGKLAQLVTTDRTLDEIGVPHRDLLVLCPERHVRVDVALLEDGLEERVEGLAWRHTRIMAHSVGLKIDHELPVGNVDIKVVVEQDGERLGVLKVSRGSVDWKPGRAKRTWSLEWERFDALMREFGHPPR